MLIQRVQESKVGLNDLSVVSVAVKVYGCAIRRVLTVE
jgi:hypothetical protein